MGVKYDIMATSFFLNRRSFKSGRKQGLHVPGLPLSAHHPVKQQPLMQGVLVNQQQAFPVQRDDIGVERHADHPERRLRQNLVAQLFRFGPGRPLLRRGRLRRRKNRYKSSHSLGLQAIIVNYSIPRARQMFPTIH